MDESDPDLYETNRSHVEQEEEDSREGYNSIKP